MAVASDEDALGVGAGPRLRFGGSRPADGVHHHALIGRMRPGVVVMSRLDIDQRRIFRRLDPGAQGLLTMTAERLATG